MQGLYYIFNSVNILFYFSSMRRRGRHRMVVGFTTTMQPLPFTTNVVSSNPANARCTRYNIM